MKRILLPGVTAGFAALVTGMVVGFLVNMILPSLVTEYNNPSLYRPWNDPAMSIFFAFPFVLWIVLSFLWDKVAVVLEGTIWRRGTHFGLAYWLVSISGMVVTYSTFPISLLMVLSWTLSALVQSICAGIVLAAMKK